MYKIFMIFAALTYTYIALLIFVNALTETIRRAASEHQPVSQSELSALILLTVFWPITVPAALISSSLHRKE